MKKYNINLPQDEFNHLDHEELDEMFEEKESLYRHGNKVPMGMAISKTKKRTYIKYDRYRYGNGEIWNKIHRKLNSYGGWNIDKARSDFYHWAKEERIPDNINLRYEFDLEFGLNIRLNRRNRNQWKIDENKIIHKLSPTGYYLKRIHEKYYKNLGHQFLGYKINEKAIKCPETAKILYDAFGRNIVNAMNGGLVDPEILNHPSISNITYKIKETYNELYGLDYRRNSNGKYQYVYGSRYNPKLGCLGREIRDLFEPVYTPDYWAKRDPKELKAEHRERVVNYRRAKVRDKKLKKELYQQIYNEGITMSRL